MIKSCVLWLNLFADLFRFLLFGLRSKSSLAAENLFLRKQLAFYQERGIKPRGISHSTRLNLLWLSRWFDWRSALTVTAYGKAPAGQFVRQGSYSDTVTATVNY